MNRLTFRDAEMVFAPISVVLICGLVHIAEGRPFMSEFLAGGVTAIILIRGLDVVRAFFNVWPENE